MDIHRIAPVFWVLFVTYIPPGVGIYAGNLNNSGVTLFEGAASFAGDGKINIANTDGTSTSLSADHVLIATGGSPNIPADVPGAQVASQATCHGS